MKFFARGLSWHCGDIHIMHDGTDITNKRTIHFLREHADFGKEFYAKGQEEITEEISADQKKNRYMKSEHKIVCHVISQMTCYDT